MTTYYIDNKKYALEKKNLLCTATFDDPKYFGFDLYAKTTRLYYPNRKTFITDTTVAHGLSHDIKIISDEEAYQFMRDHPDGINKVNYVKFFGEPEEVT